MYDALANPRLLEFASPRAERVLVGKRHGRITMTQERIEELLIENARAGRTVVRLKGGDPFVFGRGGEEAEACSAAGIPFEVVPGVSAALAVPAYAGIPLTHRDRASSVTLVTGMPGDRTDRLDYDWDALVRLGGTIVFLMATLRVDEIMRCLMAAGMAPTTPAAAIRWGTTGRQRTLVANAGSLARRMTQERLRPPVTVVIGSVVELSERIAWFEKRPLLGRRIVVTRAHAQAAELVDRLEAAGADAIVYPVIEFVEPEDPNALLRVYDSVGSYDWLVLTSVNGAERFLAGLVGAGHDIRDLAGVRIAAIGPATAARVARFGLCVAAQPDEYRAEALVEAIGQVEGQRILLARADVARTILPDELRSRGAIVDLVTVYRTVLPANVASVDTLTPFDMVTFTSASTVLHFDRLCPQGARRFLAGRAVAAIGPVTADALRSLGVAPDLVPARYTVADLADGVVDYFANRDSVE
jgi:uroporphyrinogen III methyltransferase/synthase